MFSTAMHISIAMKTKEILLPSLKLLNNELKKKSNQFKKIVKLGRTHLQDATPITLVRNFWLSFISKSMYFKDRRCVKEIIT